MEDLPEIVHRLSELSPPGDPSGGT
jgi:hypothetical protein